jgi:hypothetical protein
MRTITRVAGGTAVLMASLALMSGSALAATLSEQSIGSQTSSGAPNCQFDPSGCTIQSAGTITGSPITAGTFTSTLTILYTQFTTGNPNFAFCAPASGSATLVDGANSANTITKAETGQVCASSFGSGGSYTFMGNYTITGGTGIYSGASGSGTVNTFQPTQTSPFTGSENGTIDVPPSSADQCKHGGWMTSGGGSPTFKNQGDCVSYFASKGKNQPG